MTHQRGDQHRIAQTASRLLDVGLVQVGESSELVQSLARRIQQFRQPLADRSTPAFQNRRGRRRNQRRIAGDRLDIQPAHSGRQIGIGHGLALLPRAHRLIEVKAAVPQGIPQFVGQLIELLVVDRMWLIDDDQIQVGARANLPPCERPDRAESDAGGRHVERHRGHRVTPQAAQAIHGELRSRPALRGATPVHAVSIRLAHVHEPLLEMIDRRTQDTPPSPNSAPQAGAVGGVGGRWSNPPGCTRPPSVSLREPAPASGSNFNPCPPPPEARMSIYI